MNSPGGNRHALVLASLLAVITLALFWPVRGHDFVEYDDPDYVLNNTQVRAGLTWPGTVWAFTHSHASNWHPLTWLAHMADVQVFGLAAPAHHTVSLLLHTANSVLLFLLLRRLTGSPRRSAVVAALFAWHPLHVESVAWVAERKDVLSTLLWLLTTFAYVNWIKQKNWPRLGLLLTLFTLGLMAKAMLVTLPFTLLLLDVWPLNRLALADGKDPLLFGKLKPKLFLLLREKIPLFTLAAVSCVVTYISQARGQAVISTDTIPVAARAANAVVSYARYLGKTFWPQDLIVFYPHPIHWPPMVAAASAALLLAVTGFAVRTFRRQPWLGFGWFWFLGTLVPVIGLVQVGSQSLADRYTYVPHIGLFIALVWGAAELTARRAGRNFFRPAAVLLILGGCLAITRAQLSRWRNTETLFLHALKVAPENAAAHFNLGRYYLKQQKFPAAAEHYAAAVGLKPDSAEGHNDLAFALAQLDRFDEALAHCDAALRLRPAFAEASRNRDIILKLRALRPPPKP